jgi:hypothetical protein
MKLTIHFHEVGSVSKHENVIYCVFGLLWHNKKGVLTLYTAECEHILFLSLSPEVILEGGGKPVFY